MNWKRSLCAGLAAALLAGALAGCTAPSDVQPTPQSTPAADDIAYQAVGITRDTVLFTADGAQVTADDYLYWLLNAIAMAKNSGYLADDTAWEEEIDGNPHPGVPEALCPGEQQALCRGPEAGRRRRA